MDRLPAPVFLASLVAQLVKNPSAMWETWVQSLGWEDPLEKERLPTPVFWPGESHGLYSPRSRKESDATEQHRLSGSAGCSRRLSFAWQQALPGNPARAAHSVRPCSLGSEYLGSVDPFHCLFGIWTFHHHFREYCQC